MRINELSELFAANLLKPVEVITGYYLHYEREKIKHLSKKELKKNYSKLSAFVEKHNSFLVEFNVLEYLTYEAKKFLKQVGETGGKEFEHDEIRSLLRWYENGYDIHFKIKFKAGIYTADNYSLTFETKGETSIQFNCEYFKMNDTLRTTSMLWAYVEILKEKQAEENEKGTLSVSKTDVQIANSETENKLNSNLDVSKWNADLELLVKIFEDLRKEKLPSGKFAIVTTDENIIPLVGSNFVDANGKSLSESNNKHEKIVFNCHLKSLVFLFMYLAYAKMNKGQKDSPFYLSGKNESVKRIIRNCFAPSPSVIDLDDSTRRYISEFMEGIDAINLTSFVNDLSKSKRRQNFIPLANNILITE